MEATLRTYNASKRAIFWMILKQKSEAYTFIKAFTLIILFQMFVFN